MTSKDYEKFARIIRERRNILTANQIIEITSVCCEAFKEDNERFNEQKFVEATK